MPLFSNQVLNPSNNSGNTKSYTHQLWWSFAHKTQMIFKAKLV